MRDAAAKAAAGEKGSLYTHPPSPPPSGPLGPLSQLPSITFPPRAKEDGKKKSRGKKEKVVAGLVLPPGWGCPQPGQPLGSPSPWPSLPQVLRDKTRDPERCSWAGQACKQSKETLWFNAGSAAAFPSPSLASPAAPQCYQYPFPSSTGFQPCRLYPC